MHYAKDKCTPKVEVSPKEKETNSIVYLKVKNIGVMSKLKNNHKASRVAETPFFYNHLTYINIYQI